MGHNHSKQAQVSDPHGSSVEHHPRSPSRGISPRFLPRAFTNTASARPSGCTSVGNSACPPWGGVSTDSSRSAMRISIDLLPSTLTTDSSLGISTVPGTLSTIRSTSDSSTGLQDLPSFVVARLQVPPQPSASSLSQSQTPVPSPANGSIRRSMPLRFPSWGPSSTSKVLPGEAEPNELRTHGSHSAPTAGGGPSALQPLTSSAEEIELSKSRCHDGHNDEASPTNRHRARSEMISGKSSTTARMRDNLTTTSSPASACLVTNADPVIAKASVTTLTSGHVPSSCVASPNDPRVSFTSVESFVSEPSPTPTSAQVPLDRTKLLTFRYKKSRRAIEAAKKKVSGSSNTGLNASNAGPSSSK